MIAVILCIVIAVTLAVVLTQNKKPKPTTAPPPPTTTSTTRTTSTTTTQLTPLAPDSRIDCLPWLRNKPNIAESELETECSRIEGCSFESVDGNVNIPSCFYNTSALKLELTEMNRTELGESYEIRSRARLDATLRVDFEYLEDKVLRFKVFLF